jgi:hypothetical protein
MNNSAVINRIIDGLTRCYEVVQEHAEKLKPYLELLNVNNQISKFNIS